MKFIFLIIALLGLQFSLATAAVFEVDTLLYNGSTEKIINVVILGDGYLASELPKFEQDAEKFGLYYLSESPFKEYKNFFNLFIVKTPSNVTGAAMDPGALIDNFYGSTFNYNGIDRLLVATNSGAIFLTLADNTPFYDQIIILVNTDKYGGSGGWVAVSSTNTSAPEIVKHEVGHSFANLADEYWVGDLYANERVNQTQQTDTNLVKWKKWLHKDDVGIYQHCCGGSSSQWYKPHQNCKMQFLGPAFCPICKEAIIESIYTRCSPIYEYFPKDSVITTNDKNYKFSVQLICDTPYTYKRSWSLNSKIVSINSDSATIDFSSLKFGKNSIVFSVVDTTDYLRAEKPENIIVFSKIWTVIKSTDEVIDIKNSSQSLRFSIYPNPTSDYVNIDFFTDYPDQTNIKVFDITGTQLKTINCDGLGKNISIDLNEFGTKSLIVSVFQGDVLIFSKNIIKL